MWFMAMAIADEVPARVLAVDEALSLRPSWVARARPVLDDLVPGETVWADDVPTYGGTFDPEPLTTVRDARGHTHTVATWRLALQVVEGEAHEVWLGRVPREVEGQVSWSALLVLTDRAGTELDRVHVGSASLDRIVVPPAHALAGAPLLFGHQATRRSCPGGFGGTLFAVHEDRLFAVAHYGGFGEVGTAEYPGEADHTEVLVPARIDGRLVWTHLDGAVGEGSVLAATDRVHLHRREQEVWVEPEKTHTVSRLRSERSWTEAVRYESSRAE